MRTILHIITSPPVPLATEIIRLQKLHPDNKVLVIEPEAKPAQDTSAASDQVYDELLEAIFTAESIQVW